MEGDLKATEFFESSFRNQEKLIIPTICIVEFLSYTQLTETDKQNFFSLAKKAQILTLDYGNAIIAAQLRVKYRLKVVDSVVAAVAMSEGALLVSRDKGFKKIKEIEVIDL